MGFNSGFKGLKGKGKELEYVVVVDTLSSSSVGITGEDHETLQSCVTTQAKNKLDVHKSVHRDTTMKITNKMHYID